MVKFIASWPYAWSLMQDEARSRVARRLPSRRFRLGGGHPAALGNAQLAINAGSAHQHALAVAFQLRRSR
jgi:hypothetical protein